MNSATTGVLLTTLESRPATPMSFAASAMDAVKGADALVIITEWKAFRSPEFDEIRAMLKHPVVFDGRNLYDPAVVRSHGLEYYAVGRPQVPPVAAQAGLAKRTARA